MPAVLVVGWLRKEGDKLMVSLYYVRRWSSCLKQEYKQNPNVEKKIIKLDVQKDNRRIVIPSSYLECLNPFSWNDKR